MKKTFTGTVLPDIASDTWRKEITKALNVPTFKYTPPKSHDFLNNPSGRPWGCKQKTNLSIFFSQVGIAE